MKKTLLFLLLMQLIFISVQAQTHYGTSAGTLGANHSYFGYYAGNAAESVSYENSFFGNSSGRLTTSGYGNTAFGFYSLRNNTTGYWNTAMGTSAMSQNTVGYRNTATGRMALYANITGNYNVASGYYALSSNTVGGENTATGSRGLNSNTTGNRNVATGYNALYSNTTGSFNTATGTHALNSNIAGTNNTATGYYAMEGTTTGNYNSAHGHYALRASSGSFNCAFGAFALFSNPMSTCIGSYNSAVGAEAGPYVLGTFCDYNNTTALGAYAKVTASNQIRLGDSNVTSIGGQVSWTTLSDGRFKREIKKDVAGLDFINQLNPVSYTLDKKAINTFLRIPDSLQVDNETTRKTPTRQTGFVAQEVEALLKKSGYVFSGVEVPQNENDPYTIRYAEFVVPLVKAVQELSTQVQDLQQQLKKYANESTMDQKSAMGTGAFLYQNSPNPFSTNTEIQMDIPESHRQANVIVYNLEGKQLKNIDVTDRGKVIVNISGNELSAGMYLYTLMVDGKVVDTKRLILTN